MFLNNKNIISKIKKSKVTDYAALKFALFAKIKRQIEISTCDPIKCKNFILFLSSCMGKSIRMKCNFDSITNLYSKVCVKWPLKYRQNKDLNDN